MLIQKNKILRPVIERVAITVVRGCRCKKSNCQKRYCECYNAGRDCTSACVCLDCENTVKPSKSGKEASKPVPSLANQPSIFCEEQHDQQPDERAKSMNSESEDRLRKHTPSVLTFDDALSGYNTPPIHNKRQNLTVEPSSRNNSAARFYNGVSVPQMIH